MIKRGIIISSSLLIFFLLKTLPAHPHAFVDVAMKFIISDTSLIGIYTYWEMDEMNSAVILEYYDENKNGKFEKKELMKIPKYCILSITNSIKITYGSKSIKTENIKKFNVLVKNNKKVIYSFLIPCNIHINKLKTKELIVMFQDPTVYTAFTFQKDLIQVSHNNNIKGLISFRTIDYTEAVVFRLIKKKK